MKSLRIAATIILLRSANAFLSPSNTKSRPNQALHMAVSKNLVVISPPGGVGEVAAVEAAKQGSSVRWFVISPPTSTSSVALSAQTMNSIQNSNGGNVELAGAQADTLLLPADDADSSLKAVSTWCGSADGVICVMDGVEEAIFALNAERSGKGMDYNEIENTRNAMVDAIKVAAKEASGSASGMKVAVLPAALDDDVEEGEEDGAGFLGGLLKGNKVEVPSSLNSALGRNSVATLRHGELFGVPESSPDVSPFVGGPRKYPVFRDEYLMRSIRVDPSKTVSGNSMLGESSRSSRLAVGEAAVKMATNSVNIKSGIDVCLTSLRGMDCPEDEEWIEEFKRAQETLEKARGGELFSVNFGSVPSVERLSDWLATKWAPAVLKTYDIAGIRVGARPVYASRIGENQVEIVWQELKDFKTNFVGTMIIDVTDTGILATRGPGDASAGFGSVSSKPLNGEDILVRRLADAATQAMEKGLATKPAPKKRKKKAVVQAPVVSTVVSAGSVDTPAPAAAPQRSDAGPRTTGARRSSEKKRGKRRRSTSENDSSFQ